MSIAATPEWRPAILLIVLLQLAAGPAAGQASGDSRNYGNYAIIGVNVIPMDEERIFEDRTVIVRNGLVDSIVPAGDESLPAGFERIKGDGRFLMPGLADLHVHLRNTDELLHYVNWGVTTVMHLGGSGQSGERHLESRRQISAGDLVGPTIYTTDRVFDGDPALPNNARSLTTPAAARQAVRDVRDGGYDFIKIYNNVSKPVFDAIVSEARRQGLAVIGHIPRSFAPLDALGGGQNAIAHTEELFFTYFRGPRDERTMARDYEPDMSKLPVLIDVLVDNDVALMPDLSFTFTNLMMWDSLDHVWNDPEFSFLHPRTASMWRGGNINRREAIENYILRDQWKYRLMQTLTVEFQKAGLLQVIGTDASLPGLFPGKAAHRELTELVKAGLSNFDALSVGTRNAGEFVRKFIDGEARFGQIRPGYRADLILTEENPLDDVRHAQTISGVFVAGRYHDAARLAERRAALRERYTSMTTFSERVEGILRAADPHPGMQHILADVALDPELLEIVESHVNSAGYSAAFAGNLDTARQFLQWNTEWFPESANAWDSYAEITLRLGDTDKALERYRRALAIDPSFGNAADAIAKILEGRELRE